MIMQALRRSLKAMGIHVQRSRPAPEYLRGFLRTLWPVETDIPLIRCGGGGDGAYLLPDDLDGITALFSPGVEAVASFEDDMAARGMICYMADASVDAPPLHNPLFRFERKFLGLWNDDTLTTLDAWVSRNEPGTHDLMLQMDIEGAEWTVLSNVSDAVLARFRIIVLELHTMSQLIDQYGRQIIVQVLGRLLNTHHLVHSHPNNWAGANTLTDIPIPEVMELTFLRKDRGSVTGHATTFPHPLDIVNGPHLPALTLPDAWYARP